MMARVEDAKLSEGISNCFKKLVHAERSYSSPVIRSEVRKVDHLHEKGRVPRQSSLKVSDTHQVETSLFSSPTDKFILRPGFTINPDDYDPVNPDAPKNLALLVDDIPKVSDVWQSSGSRISTNWETLLKTGTAPMATRPDSSLKEQFEEAKKMLYSDYDTLSKSPFFACLDSAAEEVTQKQLKLGKLAAEIHHQMLGPDATQEEYDKLYARLSPPYLDALDIARCQYECRHRQVQHYLAIISAYTAAGLPAVLMDMTGKMAMFRKGASDGHVYYEVAAIPTDWWSWFKPGYNSDEGWSLLTVRQNVQTEMVDEIPIAMGDSVPFFHLTTSKGEKFTASAEDSTNIVISFKGKTVRIIRQWLDTSLLGYDNITIAGAKAGHWSTGVMEPTNKGVFPLLLTAYIVAKDISITANNFSQKLQDSFDKLITSADAKWNLLYFSGDGSHNTTWDKGKQTLSISGVQIVGGICSLIPHFPAKSHNEE